jgi:hypothetical protein
VRASSTVEDAQELHAGLGTMPPALLEQALTKPFDPSPLLLDLDAPRSGPQFHVRGLLTWPAVALVVAEPGVGKTFFSHELAAATILGRDFLGRSTRQGGVCVFDAENSPGRIVGGLAAAGLTNADLSRLHYYAAAGVRVGDPAQDAWLRGLLAEHRPALVIVDTIASATDLGDLNDNKQVAEFMAYLKELAVEFDCLFAALHHDRKRGAGLPQAAGERIMGARQFSAQADAHLALRRDGDPEDQEHGDGRTSRRVRMVLEVAKLREAPEPPPEVLCLETTSVDWALVTAEWRSEGRKQPQPSAAEELLDRITAVLSEHPDGLARADLARAVGKTSSDGSFGRARELGLSTGTLVSKGKGALRLADSLNTEPPV